MKKLFRLWPYARPQARLLLSAFGFMIVLGLATGLYAYLMGPLLRFLLTGGDDGLGAITRWAPSLRDLDRQRWLWVLPLLLVAIGVVKGVAYLGQFYSMGLFGHRVGVALRRALFTRLSQLSPIQLSQQRAGDLLSRLSTDVAAVETAANYAVGAYLRDGIQVVVMLGVAIYSEWKIALASLVVVPLTVVPAVRLTRSFLKRTRQAQAQLGAMAAQVREGVQGIRTVQAFAARTTELERFEAQVQAQLKAQGRAAWASAAVPSV
ncbi:MAG: ABC transporter transmembrane domain-containing protein, partial [Myxococcaceae bacterium]